MSGNELRINAINPPESHPENYTKVVAAQNNCPTDDNYAMMDCLRGIDARTLRATPFSCTVKINKENTKFLSLLFSFNI
jgi:hypothetical protein